MKKFEYSPLNRSRPSIRVLTVEGSRPDGLLTCRLMDAETSDDYTALSYTWGPEHPKTTITLIDEASGLHGTFQVRQNLFAFLSRAAATEADVPFWTDAICINQDDEQEKGWQVAQMGDVYHSANEIRIWLGEDPIIGDMLSVMSDILMDGEIPIKDLFDDQLCPSKYSGVFEHANRSRLLQNNYWSRTWIVQEIVLAKKITVQSASGKADWACLVGLYAPQRDHQSVHMQRLVSHWRTAGTASQSRYPIGFLFDSFGDTNCFDVRDHVYGLRALMEGSDNLEVDYTEPKSGLLVRTVEKLNLGFDELQPLFTSLGMSSTDLFADSEIKPTDLWKTQLALSQAKDILDTKSLFPPCSAHVGGQCSWSSTGQGLPCQPCEDAAMEICKMPECTNDWMAYAAKIMEDERQSPGTFSKRYKSCYKHWICSVWPEMLSGSHETSTSHLKECFACNIKARIEAKSREWASYGVKGREIQDHLTSLSQPGLASRRNAKKIALRTV